MPIFEYQCRDCGAKFERIVASASTAAPCKDCESRNVEKQLSVFAVAGSSSGVLGSEPGPCGACGAPRRGMCTE
jgi:putative FmdB family regulatory protein